MITIAFTNFYRGFEPKNSFINYILKKAIGEDYYITPDHKHADVVITSVYGKTPTYTEKTILYTPENVRPNFYKVKFSLSHDRDSWMGRNHYCPFWLSKLAWPNYRPIPETNGIQTHQNESAMDISKLCKKRGISRAEFSKKKFCAIVAGNPETLRMNLYGFLKNYIDIDGYGYAFSNPILESKHDFLEQYRFVICPENSYYPGYVTEKLFDAWYAGTVPIYAGGIDNDKLINNRAFLNYNQIGDCFELYKIIRTLNEDYQLYKNIFVEPLLRQPPALKNIINFVKNAISEILK